MYMIGWSFGLVLVNVGGLGRSTGNCAVAREIAACTSVAAASTFLERSNCRTKLLCPWPLLEVISCSPGICMNWRSRGVATLFAIVSGVAPG